MFVIIHNILWYWYCYVINYKPWYWSIVMDKLDLSKSWVSTWEIIGNSLLMDWGRNMMKIKWKENRHRWSSLSTSTIGYHFFKTFNLWKNKCWHKKYTVRRFAMQEEDMKHNIRWQKQSSYIIKLSCIINPNVSDYALMKFYEDLHNSKSFILILNINKTNIYI